MITYNVMDAGSDSIYEFLSKSIKKDILQGILKAGEKLPSKRQFAKNLGVSVITVENAYAQLMAEGYIYSIPKRGFYVSDFKYPLQERKAELTREMVSLTGEDKGWLADFTSNQTETDLFPFTIWSKVIREVLNDSRVQLMTNSACGGIQALRESIAGYLKDFRDMDVKPQQIIVGAGTEYLYGLLIQLLGRDKIYAVENPGYRKLERFITAWGSPAGGLPWTRPEYAFQTWKTSRQILCILRLPINTRRGLLCQSADGMKCWAGHPKRRSGIL